jgi:hypothetical protein
MSISVCGSKREFLSEKPIVAQFCEDMQVIQIARGGNARAKLDRSPSMCAEVGVNDFGQLRGVAALHSRITIRLGPQPRSLRGDRQ